MTIREWPVEDLERVSRCPVCRGADRELLHVGLTDRVFCIADGKWTMFQCSTCASGYLDPRPTATSIGRAYAGYYTHDAEVRPLVRRKGYVRSILHDLINDYQNYRYKVRRTPVRKSGRWILRLIPSLRAGADAECRHLPVLPNGGGRLLDIGCGNGGFLALAKQAGWDVEGIDFDPAAVETAQARGLDVRCGGYELLDKSREHYDVISLCHVLEHVYDPKDLLQRIYQSLKPGGFLWLDTPNLQSVGARRFGPAWRDLDPPRHLVLFNPESLKRCLHEAGFCSLSQHWRGMAVFDVFSASESIERGGSAIGASHQGKPPLRDILTELWEMVNPAAREFLTFTARKEML